MKQCFKYRKFVERAQKIVEKIVSRETLKIPGKFHMKHF